MKLRKGFVSNSSSSSYVIRIPKGRVLPIEEYRKWFGIEEEDPLKLQKMIISFWVAVYTHLTDGEYSYDNDLHEILDNPEELLGYYAENDSSGVARQMLYELQHPEEFPDSEIIAFMANDNEGNIINYDITETLSNAGRVRFNGGNVYAINEH